MLLLGLVLLPMVASLLAYSARAPADRGRWLLLGAGLHLLVTGLFWLWPPGASQGAWLAMDPLGLVVLTVVSVLFLAVAVCTIGYSSTDRWWGGRAFVSCLLAFLGAGACGSAP